MRVEEVKRRFEALLLASTSIIWWTDATGQFVEHQPSWQEYTGQTWDEYRGSRWMSSLHPRDRDGIVADWNKAVQTGSPYFTQGRIWSAKHRAYRASQARGIPIRDQKGEIVEWLGSITDIQDSIDIKLLLQRTQVDLVESLKALRVSEARLSAEVATLRRREEQVQMLLREVNHRSKNVLGIAQAVARQTLRGVPKESIARFEIRLHALAASHDLLVRNEWRGADLHDLIEAQLAPFGDLVEHRIFLAGKDLYVRPAAAQALGMAIHELATNATKYGALSNEDGRIDLTWHVLLEGYEPSFLIEWVEQGGPPVRQPSEVGFGSKVIGRMAEAALSATTSWEFKPAGIVWQLQCPLASLVEAVGDTGPSSPARLARAPMGSGPAILLVEDEPVVALEIERMLNEAGFAAIGPASRVAEALYLLDERPCDGAILDVRLAEETSVAIARRLNERAIPFVVLSAYSSEQLPDELKGVPYLQKPLHPERLIAALSGALQQTRKTGAADRA